MTRPPVKVIATARIDPRGKKPCAKRTDRPGAKPNGQPCTMTKEKKAKILEMLAQGNFRYVACKFAGVKVRTFELWMRKGGERLYGKYREFRVAVLEAEAKAEVEALDTVVKAAKDDPDQARWFLERKYPQRWSRQAGYVRELEGEVERLREELSRVEQRFSSLQPILAELQARKASLGNSQ